MKSDHKALIAAQEDIKLRTDEGQVDHRGQRRRDHRDRQVAEAAATPATFDGKCKVNASQAITIESKQCVTIKAPIDHARGAGPAGDQGHAGARSTARSSSVTMLTVGMVDPRINIG